MPSQHLFRLWELLKTTAIGGIFFLLPLIIVAFLISKGAQVILSLASFLDAFLPFHDWIGYSWLLTIAVFALLGICFVAGILAKRSIPKRLMANIEKYLIMAFPRYAIVKDQLAGNIGGRLFPSDLQPVLVQQDSEQQRIGLLVEESPLALCTVYLPGSPDPWAGHVVLLPRSRIQPIPTEFLTCLNAMEKLGRDLQKSLPTLPPSATT